MNCSFSVGWPIKPWTIEDDKITIGRKEYALTEITCVVDGLTPTKPSDKGCFHLRFKDGKSYMMAFNYDDRHSAFEVKEYLEKKVLKEDLELLGISDEMLEEEGGIDALYDSMKTSVPGEHRMRCKVCGHIFCYTEEDLKQNNRQATMTALAAVGGIAAAIGGTGYDMYEQRKNLDAQSSKLKDFSRCPNCNSVNIVEITEDDLSTPESSSPLPASPASVADELKKFKELLDMEILTQEEFDAKKKQLLGL